MCVCVCVCAYVCHLAGALMRDPWIASDGCSYERQVFSFLSPPLWLALPLALPLARVLSLSRSLARSLSHSHILSACLLAQAILQWFASKGARSPTTGLPLPDKVCARVVCVCVCPCARAWLREGS